MCSLALFWCRPVSFDPLIDSLVRPLPWPVAWSLRSTYPGWWTVALLSLTYAAIGDILSIFWTSLRRAALYLCCWQGWLYLYCNCYYAQLCCAELTIAYEYCWYYGVLGDQTVFLISVVCWLVCRSRMICHVPVLFNLFWFDLTIAVVPL